MMKQIHAQQEDNKREKGQQQDETLSEEQANDEFPLSTMDETLERGRQLRGQETQRQENQQQDETKPARFRTKTPDITNENKGSTGNSNGKTNITSEALNKTTPVVRNKRTREGPTNAESAVNNKKSKASSRGKKQKTEEKPKRLEYTYNNGMEVPQVPKSAISKKDFHKRTQGLNFLKDAQSQLWRLLPPAVFRASLSQAEVDAVNLQSNSKLFPVLLNNMGELRAQDNWRRNMLHSNKGKYAYVDENLNSGYEGAQQERDKKNQRQEIRKAQQAEQDYQTAYFTKRAEHFRLLIKDCEQIADHYDELAAKASTGSHMTDTPTPDDVPTIVAGLGLLFELKKKQSVKDRASLNTERWRQMERISLVAVAERLQQELSWLAAIIECSSDHLTQQELDIVSLLIHMNEMVAKYGDINLKDYTAEQLLPFLKRDPTPQPGQIEETPLNQASKIEPLYTIHIQTTYEQEPMEVTEDHMEDTSEVEHQTG